jgi:hypothetical protein
VQKHRQHEWALRFGWLRRDKLANQGDLACKDTPAARIVATYDMFSIELGVWKLWQKITVVPTIQAGR